MNHSCVKIGFFLVINPGSSRVDSLAVSLVAHAKLKNRRLPYACGTSSPLCPRCTMSCHCSCPPLCESLVKCASCRFCVVPWAAEPSLSQLSGDCSGRSTSPIPVLPPSYTLKGVTRVCHTTAQGKVVPTFDTSCCTWGVRLMMATVIHDALPAPCARASGRRHDQGLKLDFIQLRRIAERVNEALQQCAWHLHHIGLLLGR